MYGLGTAINTAAIVAGGLILWRHRSNMMRMVRGTEPKFTFRKKAPSAQTERPGEQDGEQTRAEEEKQ